MIDNSGKRDIDWIKESLQTAIELEFSTIPLYLSSMFSLEVQNYTAYNLHRSVVMEEMVHMAIVCNMLAAIGGSPRIKSIQVTYPVTGLPGGTEPDLVVGLAPLSKEQLKNFMRIEMPEVLLSTLERNEGYPTISSFYKSIQDAIKANPDAIRAAIQKGGSANQVGDDIGFSTFRFSDQLDMVEALCSGIDEIIEQGEGASAQNLITNSEFENEECHYAKFAALYYGAQYSQPTPTIKLTPQTEAMFFKGNAVGWPEVINTLAVPSDGYEKILKLDANSEAVRKDLAAFDATFSDLLLALDNAWNGPLAVSWKTLGASVHSMVDLRVLSCFNIMRHQIPQEVIAKLGNVYPMDVARLSRYTDLTKPVFYGPRFININKP